MEDEAQLDFVEMIEFGYEHIARKVAAIVADVVKMESDLHRRELKQL